MNADTRLRDGVAREVRSRLADVRPGHCARIDGVAGAESVDLVSALRLAWPDADIFALVEDSNLSLSEVISTEDAIGLRNRKIRPLLLVVPSSASHAASSLDNSFEAISYLTLLEAVAKSFQSELADSDVADALSATWKQIKANAAAEDWARFLAELIEQPDMETWARNLWRVGLVPDLGEDPLSRLESNRQAVRSISRPRKAIATIVERLVNAGVREDPIRERLALFFERQPTLTEPRSWTQRLLAEEAGVLTFEQWPLVETVASHLESVTIKPFIDEDGVLDKACKLRAGPDGVAICDVPVDGTGTVVLQWKTDPPKLDKDVLAKWLLEVVPPEDLRSEDAVLLGSVRAPGDRRRATVKVSASEEDLSAGRRFVVRLRAETADGQYLQLSSGEDVDFDSQEFDVETILEAVEPTERSANVGSIPEGTLLAAIDGLDNRTEEQGAWDLERSVFSLRLGGRRIIKMQVAATIVALQRRAVDSGNVGAFFTGAAGASGPPSPDEFTSHEFDLPATLKDKRARVMTLFKGREIRDTAEVVDWDEELAEAVSSYVSTYRRTMDNAKGEDAIRLAQLDTVNMSVATQHGTVTGVLVLPIHPLRLEWIRKHDALFREWANALAEYPKAGRPQLVDSRLIARVLPVNLPFVLPNNYGEANVYFDELTFGSAMYIPPDTKEPESAVVSLAQAFGVNRRTQRNSVTAGHLSERLSAYVTAHPGGVGLRLLALDPGQGDLIADALVSFLGSDLEDDDLDEGVDQPDLPIIDLIAYADRASFARPLGALQQVQQRLRNLSRRSPLTFLTPPLGLSRRSLHRLNSDKEESHVGIVQSAAAGEIQIASDEMDRAPSLEGLLVPATSQTLASEAGFSIATGAATLSRGAGAEEITAAHRSHQALVARSLNDSADGLPVLVTAIGVNEREQIQAMHERADWVVTIDRQVGVGLYSGHALSDDNSTFILDYAPDFIDGMGDRLTVTTTHGVEVEKIIGQALEDLDVHILGRLPEQVLSGLSWVSGRLALRLLNDTTLAREAVSLAALMMHFRDRGELNDAIVIPVDAHPEIFGASSRETDQNARRCDLLIIRLGPRSFKIELIEVKARRKAQLPQALADAIADQLLSTQDLLQRKLFRGESPRIDASLQWARFAGLLHFYADRSASNGFIDQGRIEEVHRFIDRIEAQQEAASISLRGFVVSLSGNAGFPKKVRGVPITVLTNAELGKLGFTTMMGAEAESAENIGDPVQAEESSTGEPSVGMPESESPESASSPADEGESSPAGNVMEEEVAEGGDTASVPREVTVHLGVDANEEPVDWTVSTKGSPHAFILGIPGQGKSVTTRRILNEFEAQGLPALVVDFHGDMARRPPQGAQVIDASDGLPFSPFEMDASLPNAVNQASWEIAEILSIVFSLGEIQRNSVYAALQGAYSAAQLDGGDHSLPTMDGFVQALVEAEGAARGRNARARLTPLTDFGLFSDEGDRSLHSAYIHGAVIDLSRLGLEQVQLAASAFLLRKVYNDMFQWPQHAGMRLAIVVDEAHRLARDVTLPRLMKDGRKYGVSVVVASQGVEDFHQQVLENAGSKVVFRTNYPASKKVAGFLRARGAQDLTERIEQLGVGQAYVSTPEHVGARKTYMSSDE